MYPIHLVWESGFKTTLEDVVRGKAGKRGFTDLTDLAVEAAARVLGGRKFWDDMKLDSAGACLPAVDGGEAGGAYVLAAALREYMAANAGAIELHIAGHSAGSIYHSHFVPRLFEGDDKVDSVKSVTFLAPAVRVDTFEATLLPLAETGKIENLSIFTMNENQEKRDNTAGVYRKSLLYLVSRAFEAEKDAEILGLEEHLRRSGRTMAYLGDASERLVLGPVARGRRSSTQATSHGDFDNDEETMMSLARRVVGVPDSGEADHVAVFPSRAREVSEFTPAPRPEPTGARGAAPRKLALCIGIDAYPKDPLSGCVADAEAWAEALGSAGFTVESIHNADATRDAILRAMLDKVSSARDGDIVAIQFSGHGTFVPDLDGDETDAFGPKDEALCPVDFRDGQLIVDDDLGAVWDAIPEGVSVTLFFDSCHSGSVNREITPAEFESRKIPAGATPRMTVLDADEEAAFRRERAASPTDAFRTAAWKRVVEVETDRAAVPRVQRARRPGGADQRVPARPGRARDQRARRVHVGRPPGVRADAHAEQQRVRPHGHRHPRRHLRAAAAVVGGRRPERPRTAVVGARRALRPRHPPPSRRTDTAHPPSCAPPRSWRSCGRRPTCSRPAASEPRAPAVGGAGRGSGHADERACRNRMRVPGRACAMRSSAASVTTAITG